MAKKPTDETVEAAFDESDMDGAPSVNGPGSEMALVGSSVQPNVIPESFDEAVALLREAGHAVEEYESSPWHPVEKARLVGVPFIIMGWRFNQGDKGVFVSLTAVTKLPVLDQQGNPRTRVVINDGGTGIRAQWEAEVYSGRAKPGKVVSAGLRVSNYEYTNDKGETESASTYYFG